MPNYIPNAPLNPDNYRYAGELVPFFLDYYILSVGIIVLEGRT
ncbi:MAG: hypothetical protein SGJ10_02580 [Bacteroidota bacterium]|nr:hypothetical protein [Bacteroidota bacterium]